MIVYKCRLLKKSKKWLATISKSGTAEQGQHTTVLINVWHIMTANLPGAAYSLQLSTWTFQQALQ